MTANADGWSDWVFPIMNNYKMTCCDCGLVHDMEFAVQRVVKHNADGTFVVATPRGEYRVELRARRNNRSTAAVRRARS